MNQGLPLLGSSSADTHGTIAAVHALHLMQSSLLITLIGKAHKSVTARLSSGSIRHDLGGLAALVLVLKQLYEDKLVDLRTQIANEDAVLGATVVAAAAKC